LQAEIVGRQAELQALQQVMVDLKQGGPHRVCFRRRRPGEKPVGERKLPRLPGAYRPGGNWYETLSLSYESNQAYGLLKRLIRRISGIAYDDHTSLVREKLVTLLESLPFERRTLANQLFEALFGLEQQDGELLLEGETFKQELFETIQIIWKTLFANRPTVMVFDDLHWSDTASIDLLLRVLPLTEEIPLVLLCAMRNERQLAAWQIKTTSDQELHHRYTELILHPLSEAESNELVDRLLNYAELPPLLRANILEKSGGNPFFIEEVVRTLIDSEVLIPKKGSKWKYTTLLASNGPGSDLLSRATCNRSWQPAWTAWRKHARHPAGRFCHRSLIPASRAAGRRRRRPGTGPAPETSSGWNDPGGGEGSRSGVCLSDPLTQEAIYQTILIKRRRSSTAGWQKRWKRCIPIAWSLSPVCCPTITCWPGSGSGDRLFPASCQPGDQVFAYEEAVQNLQAALELIKAGEKTYPFGIIGRTGDAYHLC
jgi:hypothetical protein